MRRAYVPRARRDRTIGDLRRNGHMLEFVCIHCLASRSFDPRVLPFGDLQLIATASRRMKCSFCGHDGEGSLTRPTPLPHPQTERARTMALAGR